MTSVRFELPTNQKATDHTKLRLAKEYPKPGKINKLSYIPPAHQPKQALMGDQTTVTGEGVVSERFQPWLDSR